MSAPAAVPCCILVRHAHAEWPGYRGADFDRPLTNRGIADAHAAGQAIRSSGLKPAAILASAAHRTTQTAQILIQELYLPPDALELRDSLYNADVDALRSGLEEVAASGRLVLLVAHNPGISELARLLSGDAALPHFRPAEWLCLSLSSGDARATAR